MRQHEDAHTVVLGVGCGAVLGVLVAVLPQSEILSALLLAGALAAALLLLGSLGASRVSTILLLAFLLRVGFALFNSQFSLITDRLAEPLFHRIGTDILVGWQTGAPLGFSDIPEGIPVASYSYFVAAVYFLLGKNPLFVYVLNSFFDALAIGVIYRVAAMVFGARAALWVACIETFSPYMVWMAGTFLRESLSRLALGLFLYELLCWADGRRGSPIRLLPWLAMASLLRPENLPILAVVIGAAWLLGRRRDRRPRFDRRRLAIGAFVALPILIVAVLFVFQFSTELFKFGGGPTPEFFESFRQARTHGGSTYLESLRYTSFLDILLYAPIRALYFLLVPFPWQVQSLSQLAALLGDSVLQLVLFVLAVSGARRLEGLNWRLVAIVTAYLLVGAASYGLVEGNVGAALRHRRQFTFVVAMLAAPQLIRFVYELLGGRHRTSDEATSTVG